jgi:hypothetical protein
MRVRQALYTQPSSPRVTLNGAVKLNVCMQLPVFLPLTIWIIFFIQSYQGYFPCKLMIFYELKYNWSYTVYYLPTVSWFRDARRWQFFWTLSRTINKGTEFNQHGATHVIRRDMRWVLEGIGNCIARATRRFFLHSAFQWQNKLRRCWDLGQVTGCVLGDRGLIPGGKFLSWLQYIWKDCWCPAHILCNRSQFSQG